MPQVDGATTVLADRYANQVVLTQASTDLDGDQAISLALPAGLGDVLISELTYNLSTFATAATNLFELGIYAVIVGPAGALVDFVGVGEWVVIAGTLAAPTRAIAHLAPDTPVLWRENERLRFIFAEPDTNAAPSTDGSVLVRALRLTSGSPQQAQEFLLTS